MAPQLTSRIWQYFEKSGKGDGAMCKDEKCPNKGTGKVVIPCASNNTTGLWWHLEHYHPAVFKEEKELKKDPKKATPKVKEQPLITESLKRTGPKYGKNHPVQRRLDKNIENLMVLEGMPFRMVGSESFKKLVADLDPKAKLHHRTYYAGKIRKKGKLMKRRVGKEVRARVLYSLGMTADGWESRAQDDYIGSTAHFITENFELQRLTLGCRPFVEKHSGSNIREVLEEEMTSLKLKENTLKVLITDAASNMVVARRIEGVQVLNCSNHQLQLCIQDALKKSPLNEDLAKAVEAAIKLSKFA